MDFINMKECKELNINVDFIIWYKAAEATTEKTQNFTSGLELTYE